MIKKIAKLAKIAITEEEQKQFTKQVGEIIKWVEQLNEIDTNNVVFEFRGMDDPAVPAVELRVPLVKGENGLAWMHEVWDDQGVIDGLQLVLA